MIFCKIFRICLIISFCVGLGFLKAKSTSVTDHKKPEVSKEETNEEAEEEELTGGVQTDQVLIRGLNKVTAHISDIVAPVGQKAKFGHLEITARLCQKSPPEDPPESTAYLEIQEVKPDEKPSALFSGWMFASSPAISALEHPVYDIWVLNCQGRIIHELPVTDTGSLPLSLEDTSPKSQNLSSETPTIEAFNRGFNHPQ
ncbi:MAG: DUF2155 domain-containing protein [Janthinobacterium lividum]